MENKTRRNNPDNLYRDVWWCCVYELYLGWILFNISLGIATRKKLLIIYIYSVYGSMLGSIWICGSVVSYVCIYSYLMLFAFVYIYIYTPHVYTHTHTATLVIYYGW